MRARSEHVIEPFFLDGTKGRLFCVFVAPRDPNETRHAVLHIPAFAEEMNKSRPMVTQQAHRLASVGIATLVFDYFGTGDSEGEFQDASIDTWVRDAIACIDWLQAKGIGKLSLCANRFGAGIALDALKASDATIDSLVLWQPITNGATYLKQFLRLRRAAEMFYSSAENDTESADDPTEVAGYLLQPDMAESMESMRIAEQTPVCSRVALFEVSNLPEPALSRPARLVVDTWSESGIELTIEAVSGEPYWSTLETSINENILECTARYFSNDS